MSARLFLNKARWEQKQGKPKAKTSKPKPEAPE
jgi:hypothetical protein